MFLYTFTISIIYISLNFWRWNILAKKLFPPQPFHQQKIAKALRTFMDFLSPMVGVQESKDGSVGTLGEARESLGFGRFSSNIFCLGTIFGHMVWNRWLWWHYRLYHQSVNFYISFCSYLQGSFKWDAFWENQSWCKCMVHFKGFDLS